MKLRWNLNAISLGGTVKIRHMESTICAISTPAGVGGIAVARVSGPEAIAVCQKLWRGKSLECAASHTSHLGTVVDSEGSPLDQAVATVFRAPNSFTGEDVVELSVHGSRYVQHELLNSLISAGAVLAQPGEFTRRAFAAGKMDLAQAEAVADVIASESRAAHRIAISQMRGHFSQRLQELREKLVELASLLELELDFSEEDVEFASRARLLEIAGEVQMEVRRLGSSFRSASAIKDGIPVAIVGATNAGKSSLLNALLGDDRAIVSDIHGTTRDIVEDMLTIGDYRFRIMDTAGLRSTTDTIENLGIERSLRAAGSAQIVIIVIDRQNPTLPDLPASDATTIIAVNKTDLKESPHLNEILSRLDMADAYKINISARNGAGIDTLRQTMEEIARSNEGDDSAALVTNARHFEALLQADEAITRAIEAIESNLSGDLIAMDIRLTIHHLNSILGTITSQDILNSIFERFCIGK